MTHSTVSLPPAPAPAETVPPLENGDRLTREEFERRYEAMPDLKKAELVEGVVYMPSPVRLEQHGEPHLDLACWLGFYRVSTPGIRGGDNSTVRLDTDNAPQPDLALFIDPKCGGQAVIDKDGYIAGGPELAAEITASSVSIDLGSKFNVYRRNRVREYIVWRVLERTIDWFVWGQSQFDQLAPHADGVLRSQVLPGLWLDSAAMVAGDLLRVHQVLQLGIASSEHAQFVATLQHGGKQV